MDARVQSLIALKEQGSEAAAEIVQILHEMKISFSISWFETRCQGSTVILKEVWLTLFGLTEFEDANVNIAAFNALGSFLITLTPFLSRRMTEIFCEIANQVVPSVNASMTIIASFAFLSQRVAAHEVTNFLGHAPVLHHFGVDFSPLIRQIPNLIHQFSALDIEIHMAMMRNLLKSFGKAPSSQFVEAILYILDRFPDLANDLMGDIKKQDLRMTLMAVGSHIIKHPAMSMNSEMKELMLSTTEKLLMEEESSASDLEYAINVLLIMRQDENEELKARAIQFSDELWNRDVKSYVRRTLLPLALSFDILRPTEDDAGNVILAKISAWDGFVAEHTPAILDLCVEFMTNKREIYTAIVEFLARNMTPLSVQCPAQVCEIIATVLSRPGESWIQQLAIIKLIESVNQFRIMKSMPNFGTIAIDLIIDAALSPHRDLSTKACEVAKEFIGLHNAVKFIVRVWHQDLFEAQTAERVLKLLSALVSELHISIFSALVPLVKEMVLIYAQEPFVHLAFRFLSYFMQDENRSDVLDICIRKMEQYYWSVTGKSLLHSGGSTHETLLGHVTEGVTTDILSSDDLSSMNVVEPLCDCFKYYASVAGAKKQAQCSAIARSLFPILPEEVSVLFIKKGYTGEFQIKRLKPYIEDIMFSAREEHTLILCCDYYAVNACDESVYGRVDAMVASHSVKSSALAVCIVRWVLRKEPDRMFAVLEALLNQLPDFERNEVALIMSLWKHDDVVNMVHVRFPFTDMIDHPEKTLDWLRKTPVYNWPVSPNRQVDGVVISDMFARILSTTNDKIVITDYEKHSVSTWKWIVEHRKLFEPRSVKDYIYKFVGKDRLKKVVRAVVNAKVAPFTVPKIGDDVSRSATATPLIGNGVLPASDVLLRSFLMYSKVTTTKEILEQICKERPHLVADAKLYGARVGVRFSIDADYRSTDAVSSIFSMKSRFLRETCAGALFVTKEAEVEVMRMLAIERIHELKSDKGWFFFTRFLRMSIDAGGNKKKSMLYRRVTSERVPNILKAFDRTTDFVVEEMCKLIEYVVPAENRQDMLEQWPELRSAMMKYEKEDSFIPKVPSRLIRMFRCDEEFVKVNLSRIFERRKRAVTSNLLVSEEFIAFLHDHIEQMTMPYLNAVLNVRSPILPLTAALMTTFLRSRTLVAVRWLPVLEDIVLNAWSVPQVPALIKAFYDVMMTMDAGTDMLGKQHQQLLNVFLSNSTAEGAVILANALIEGSQLYDTLGIITSHLMPAEGNFIAIFAVVQLFCRAAGKSQRERLGVVMKKAELPVLSRRTALALARRELYEPSFRVCLLETDDRKEIKHTYDDVNM